MRRNTADKQSQSAHTAYVVGSVTVGIPMAMLSSDVLEPPNGNGTSATSPAASTDRNGMLPGCRGTKMRRCATSGITRAQRSRSCGGVRIDGWAGNTSAEAREIGSEHASNAALLSGAWAYELRPAVAPTFSEPNHRVRHASEDASQHAIELRLKFESAVKAHVHDSGHGKPQVLSAPQLAALRQREPVVPVAPPRPQ